MPSSHVLPPLAPRPRQIQSRPLRHPIIYQLQPSNPAACTLQTLRKFWALGTSTSKRNGAGSANSALVDAMGSGGLATG